MLRVVFTLVTLSVLQYGCLAQGICTDALAEVEATLNASPGLVGLERPNCDTDGSYLGMQTIGSVAYCVTKEGTKIERYQVNRWETGTDMNCQCARDQFEYGKLNIVGKIFSCEENGNYKTVGCTGSVCYCQDKQGNQVGTSTVNIGLITSLNC